MRTTVPSLFTPASDSAFFSAWIRIPEQRA
jgi:hypothetical protein